MSLDLLSHPRWLTDDLGLPMPDDPHAVSACLPLWRHNVGYEEGDATVLDALQAAYPRFRFHPKILELCSQQLDRDDSKGLPFASEQAAQRAIAYVTASGGTVDRTAIIGGDAIGVIVPDDSFPLLKQYWQHAGENLSSRSAELLLNGKAATCTEISERKLCRERVAALHATIVDHVFLFPSGMAAIACAWRIIQQVSSGPTCQFGFPYVDTLKIQQRFPNSQHAFYPVGNEAELKQLAIQCRSSPPVAVFCEVPTNPLLGTPDLPGLRQLADQYDFLLVVDDTLGACQNLNVEPFADLIVTSLTKYFSGYGNVLAGSLVVPTEGRRHGELATAISDEFEETLADCDARVLAKNSADLDVRISRINDNANQLAEFLTHQPAVASVFYPSQDSRSYEAIRRPGGGYGGLLSVVLKDPQSTTTAVFDALRVCKGPNLGTNFTLCCPYTILAHYDELPFAETCGVSRWLLRISVGMEPIEDLKQRFLAAFQKLASTN